MDMYMENWLGGTYTKVSLISGNKGEWLVELADGERVTVPGEALVCEPNSQLREIAGFGAN